MQHQDTRVAQQSYMSNRDLSIQTKSVFLLKNIYVTHAMLFVPGQGDTHGLHNYPFKRALNPIVNILFWGGLMLGLTRYRANKFVRMFGLYYVISIFPALLTYPWENPNMLRTFTMLVPLVFFSGLSVQFLARRIPKRFVVTVMLLLVVISAAYELKQYFFYQTHVMEQTFDIKDRLLIVEPEYYRNFYRNQ